MTAKNSLLWACFIIIMGMPLLGQSLSTPVEFKKSEIFRDEVRTTALVFAESDGNGGLVLIRAYGTGAILKIPEGYLIEHYNSDLKKVMETEISTNNTKILNLIVRDGMVHLLKKVDNRKTGQYDYYTSSALLNRLYFESELIVSVDNPHSAVASFIGDLLFGQMLLGDMNLPLPWLINRSQDSEYTVSVLSLNDREHTGVRLLVFNPEFEMTLDHSITYPRSEGEFEFQDYAVNEENGNLFVLGKQTFKRRSGDIQREGIDYKLKLYRIDGAEATQTEFETEANYLGMMTLLLSSKGLLCVGTYSERPQRNFKGMAYFRFDPENLENKVSRLNPFPESFLTEAYGEGRGSRRASREVGIEHLEYRDFYVDDHGNIFFNAEEVLSRRQWFDQKYVFRNETKKIIYRTIYTCKINSSGEFDYLRTIRKRQVAIRDKEHEFFSYSSALINGKMHFFINAGSRVRVDKNGEFRFRSASTNRLNLYAVEVTADGSLNYIKLIARKDSRLTYKTKFGLHTNSGSILILEANRRRQKQLL
ncbi:MAG: hypothetical protein EA409_11380 [Saprospirales bacterium]|nr:MAG: hypothetical protein EA409_11380 [Saprospirales bacterium]